MSESQLASQVAELRRAIARLRSFDSSSELIYGQGQIATEGRIPIGGIIMWSGAEADIPDHWALCDGTLSTPDLRNRFIVGAGDTYTEGDVGGLATQANHVVTQPSDHTGHGAHGDHSDHLQHTHRTTNNAAVQSGAGATVYDEAATELNTESAGTGTVTHTAHSNNAAISAHAGAAVNAHGTNLPPYYALCFIMRIT